MFNSPHEDINKALTVLVSDLHKYFSDNLYGVYLFGSLAFGDFNYSTSDIDICVITNSDINKDDFLNLDQLHSKLITLYPYWKDRLEIAYIARRALNSLKSEPHQIALISPGEKYHTKTAGLDWLINYYLLQNGGITLFGENPNKYILKITKNEYLALVKMQALEWRDWIIKTKDSIPYQYYAVLTLCRALYVLFNGEQVSKREAGKWMMEKHPKWQNLIKAALISHTESKYSTNDNLGLFHEVSTFCNEVLNIIENETTVFELNWPVLKDI